MSGPDAKENEPKKVRSRPSGAGGGGAYHHGDLPAALIRAAAETLEEHGLEGLSLRSVARRAGVSHAAPYHHFRDKTQLLAAVATVGFRGLTAAMKDAVADLPDDASCLDRIEAIGHGYVRHAAAHPAVFRVMFRPDLNGAHEDNQSLHDAGEEAFHVLLDLVVAAHEAGEIRSGNPLHHALGAWSSVHGVSVLWVDGPLEYKRDTFGGLDVESYAGIVCRQIRVALANA